MNPINKKEFLTQLKARCALMHPGTRASLEPFIDGAISAVADPEHGTALQDLQKGALTDREKFRQLNAIRTVTVQNFVTAMANAAAFFELIELKENEAPYLKNETRQEIKARFIGEDGKPRMVQARKDQTETAIDLRYLSTDEVEYPLVDIYKGRVAEQAKSNVELAYDLAMKENAELWALVQASIGNFTLTGNKPDRVYVAHSTIKTANLPTSNLITVPGNTTSTKFRFAAVKAAIQWCLAWGNNAISTGEIRPVNIYIPSSHLGDMLDEIDIDSPDNSLVQEIIDVGYVLKVGGKQFNLIPDATLDPALYRAYVRTNVPLGNRFDKPSLNATFPESPDQITNAERHANKGHMSMRKVYGAVVPNPQRLGVLGIQYRTV